MLLASRNRMGQEDVIWSSGRGTHTSKAGPAVIAANVRTAVRGCRRVRPALFAFRRTNPDRREFDSDATCIAKTVNAQDS